MVEGPFAAGFFEQLKVFFVAVLIYVIIYATLKKIQVLGSDDKVNALVALLAAVIVSFSGVVTYAVSYAINWFFILFFVVFLMLVMLLFLGVSPGDVASKTKDNAKPILIIFGILFGIILIKSFFALNNLYDTNNPQNDSYAVNASFNTGTDDVTNQQVEVSGFSFGFVDSDLFSAVLFLMGLGVFVIFLGR